MKDSNTPRNGLLSVKEYRIEKQQHDNDRSCFMTYGTKTVVTGDIAKEIDNFTDDKTERVIVTITRQYAEGDLE